PVRRPPVPRGHRPPWCALSRRSAPSPSPLLSLLVLLPILGPQRHRVDDEQIARGQLDSHDLQRDPHRVVAQVYQARRLASETASRWRLLEPEPAMPDDVSDARWYNAVLACRPREPQPHQPTLASVEQNITGTP